MKKLTAIVLSVAFCLSLLTGCNKSEEKVKVNKNQNVKACAKAGNKAGDIYEEIYGIVHSKFHSLKEFTVNYEIDYPLSDQVKEAFGEADRQMHRVKNANDLSVAKKAIDDATNLWSSQFETKFPEIKESPDYLALKKLLAQKDKECEEKIKAYNEQIDKYNKYRPYGLSKRRHFGK